jgi:hypothetical protein
MLGVTFFGLLLTPVFYVLLRRLGARPIPAVTAESATGRLHVVAQGAATR